MTEGFSFQKEKDIYFLDALECLRTVVLFLIFFPSLNPERHSFDVFALNFVQSDPWPDMTAQQ